MRYYLHVQSDAYNDVSSGTKAIVDAANDESWLMAVYTKDAMNPKDYKDYLDIGTIIDGNNLVVSGHITVGGYLINPASVTLNYLNDSTALKQAVTYVGERTDGTLLSDYYLSSSGIAIPYPPLSSTSLWGPTPTEQEAIEDALKVYWRIGQTVTFTAPDISGYQTPDPATQTFVLGAATNSHDFLYTLPTNDAGIETLSNTGQSFVLITLSFVLGTVVSLIYILRKFFLMA